MSSFSPISEFLTYVSLEMNELYLIVKSSALEVFSSKFL